MSARLAADLLLAAHLLFVVFVVLGGLLVLWRPRLAWLHLPALAWGVWIEASGGICPLTPWENRLRRLAGESGYPGGFIEHYLLPIVYPHGLTPAIQLRLAIGLAILNLVIYGVLIVRTLRRQDRGPQPTASLRQDREPQPTAPLRQDREPQPTALPPQDRQR